MSVIRAKHSGEVLPRATIVAAKSSRFNTAPSRGEYCPLATASRVTGAGHRNGSAALTQEHSSIEENRIFSRMFLGCGPPSLRREVARHEQITGETRALNRPNDSLHPASGFHVGGKTESENSIQAAVFRNNVAHRGIHRRQRRVE